MTTDRTPQADPTAAEEAPERSLYDLMLALEDSLKSAKAARDRHNQAWKREGP